MLETIAPNPFMEASKKKSVCHRGCCNRCKWCRVVGTIGIMESWGVQLTLCALDIGASDRQQAAPNAGERERSDSELCIPVV